MTNPNANYLELLPPELLLNIFSYLELPHLIIIPRLSKAFNNFFNYVQNAPVIWRNVCVLHGLVGFSVPRAEAMGGEVEIESEPPRREWGRWIEWAERRKEHQAPATDVLWSDVVNIYSEQSSGNVAQGCQIDWEAFIKRRLEIHRSWAGQLPSSIIRYADDDPPLPTTSKSHLAAIQRVVSKIILRERTVPTLADKDILATFAAAKLESDGSLDEGGQRVPEQAEEEDSQLKTGEVKRASGLRPNYPFQLELDHRGSLKPGLSFADGLALDHFQRLAYSFLPTSGNVHRIKVDERNGFFITTSREGGLIVRDIITKQMTWCLPLCYVRPYAHLEYEQGYIIFDRTDGTKEVWRSTSITQPANLVHSPDHRQRVAAALANGDNDELLQSDIKTRQEQFGWSPPLVVVKGPRINVCHAMNVCSSFLDGPSLASYISFEPMLTSTSMLDRLAEVDRGAEEGNCPSGSGSSGGGRAGAKAGYEPKRLQPQFVPHMVIPVPTMDRGDGIVVSDVTRAYRFVYPHLLAASSSRAYVWDLRTGEQTQIVDSLHMIRIPAAFVPKGASSAPTPAGVVRVLSSSTVGPVTMNEGCVVASETAGGEQDVQMRDLKKKGKARALEAVEDPRDAEEDVAFPTYRPFKSGFFDENASFSENFPSKSSAASSDALPSPLARLIDPSASSADPLALQTNTPTPLGDVRYVELGERWIFVCGQEGLRVYARKDNWEDVIHDRHGPKLEFEPGQLVLRIPSDRIHYSQWSARLGVGSHRPHPGSELVRQEVVWDDEVAEQSEEEANMGEVPMFGRAHGHRWPQGQAPNSGAGGTGDPSGNGASREGGEVFLRRRRKLHDTFIAAHVSPDQKHLVALLSSSRVLFLPWFERVVNGERSVWDVGVDLQLGKENVPSVYLSYGVSESGSGGCAGRFGVVTERGIFVVAPYLRHSTLGEREVDLVVLRLAPSFLKPFWLADISCLQMSDTGLWVNWPVPESKDWALRRGGFQDSDSDEEEEYDDDDGNELYSLDMFNYEFQDGSDWEDQEEDVEEGEEEEEPEDGDDGREVITIGGASAGTSGRSVIGSAGNDGTRPYPINPNFSWATPDEEQNDLTSEEEPSKAKGKQPEAAEGSGSNPGAFLSPMVPSWLNQKLPSGAVQFRGSENNQGLRERSVDPTNATGYDRDIVSYETEFVAGLEKRRVKEMKLSGDGARLLPNGDMHAEVESGESPFDASKPLSDVDGRFSVTAIAGGHRVKRSEVHQVRFVP